MTRTPGRARKLFLLTSTALVSLGGFARGDDFVASNAAELGFAITLAGAVPSTTSTITLTGNITLAGALPIIGATGANRTLTIIGNGFTVSGGGASRIFFINSGTVAIQNTVLTNGVAIGGAGGDADIRGGSGGGGGLGGGGGVFVRSGASLTLEGVAMTGNSATGGAGGQQIQAGFLNETGGGGGGMGGRGGLGVYDETDDQSAGGGGGGTFIAGQNGNFTSAGAGGGPNGGAGGGPTGGTGGEFSGGGGAFVNLAPGPQRGGGGGFGGGGGGGVTGGAGGFGGGGGGGLQGGNGGFGGGQGGTLFGGTPGFGGGSTIGQFGGGGAGLGGAVFVMEGSTLLVRNGRDVAGTETVASGGAVTGGAAGGGLANAGQGLGTGFFLEGGASVTFQTDAGRDAIMSDTIASNLADGGITKQGAGILRLTGLGSTYTGGTRVTDGTLVVFNDTSLGGAAGGITISNGATLRSINTLNSTRAITLSTGGGTLDTLSANMNLTGPVTGAGKLVKRSAGTLTLSAANTFSGGMTVEGGTLRLLNNAAAGTGAITTTGSVVSYGNGVTLANPIVINSNTTQLEVLGADTATQAGDISETGGARPLEKIGTGTLTLTGANTYTGSTTISGGALRIGNGGTTGSVGAGNVVNNGILTFERSNALTFSNVISGAGSLNQNGTGSLILNGTNTYTGATAVNGGSLFVNGSAAASSGLTVNTGGVVGGTGQLPGTTVNAGGALAPGNSVGTITVNGNLTLNAGSATTIEVQGPAADRINVTGTATLAGTLQVVPLGGAYAFNTPYTILNAAGGRAGTFATVQSGFTGALSATVTYDPNNVFLTLSANPLSPLLSGGTQNRRNAAAAIDSALLGGRNIDFLLPLFAQPAVDGIRLGLDQLSGQVHTAAAPAGAVIAGQFLSAMLDPNALGRQAMGGPLAYAPEAGSRPAGISAINKAAGSTAATDDSGRIAVWATMPGTSGHVDGNARIGSHRRAERAISMSVGADMRAGSDAIVGGAMSGGRVTASLAAGLGAMTAEVFQAGVYGFAQYGALSLGGAAAYTMMEIDSTRAVPVLGIDTLKATYRAHGFSGRFEAAYDLARWPGLSFAPVAALQVSTLYMPAFTETNATGIPAAGLTVASGNAVALRGELGGRVEIRTRMNGTDVSFFARAAWGLYGERDAQMSAAFTGLPGLAFTVTGAQADRNTSLLSAGFDMALTPSVSFGARFDGEYGANITRTAGTARLRIEF